MSGTANNLYVPPSEFIEIERGTLQCVCSSLQAGREHAKSLLVDHDSSLGRTTRKNQYWAEVLEKDIKNFDVLLKILEGKGIHE